jgi:hypothetical protein
MRTFIFVSLIGCFAGAAGAEEPAPPPAATDPSAAAAPPTEPAPSTVPAPSTPAAPVVVAKPAPKPLGKLLVYTSFAFNVYTYLGESGMAPATNITPADRAIIYEQVGFGYFVHPKVRLTLTLLFGETVTGLPATASKLTVFSIIPWVVYTDKGFFTGIGPSLAPISYGKAGNFDAGIFTATGYTFKLGHGVSLSPLVQLVLMLNQRLSFAVTPGLALAYRF